MNAMNYTLLAYGIGILALWGYALLLWIEWRSLARREKRR